MIGSAEPSAGGGGPAHIVQIAPAPYVLIPLASKLTGLSERAIERKIEQGIWIEGREWRRGPDGHRYISLRGYQAWIERG